MKFLRSSGHITLLALMSDNMYFHLRKFIKDIKLQCPKLFYWGITVVGMIDCLIFHMVDLSLQTSIPWRLS